MKNVAISIKGKVNYVADWPDEPNEKDFSGDQWKENAANLEYLKACEQALANAIEFKDQEQIRKLLWSIPTNSGDSGDPDKHYSESLEGWQMEPFRPYDVPEGIKIEINYFRALKGFTVPDWKLHSDAINDSDEDKMFYDYRQFAFIKHEEIYKCQDCGDTINKGEFKTFGICDSCWDKAHPKEETQDELWEEVFDYCETHIINDIKLHLVKSFRIERIK